MSSPSAARRTAVWFIVLANVLGGMSYPAQGLALAGLPPATVTCLRNAVALVALGICLRLRGGSRTAWTRAELGRVVALGTLAFALPMYLGILGVQRASASNASILILLEPVTIVAIAGLVLGERVSAVKLAILALGLAGALCIVLEGASLGDLFGGENFAGNALLALHGVLWGCYTPLAKPLTERHDPFDLCLRATAIGTLALVPAALAERSHWSAGPALAPALAWTVAIGICISFGGTVLWLAALRHLPATNVAGFVFLQPLAGVLVGVLLLGEHLSAGALLGAALIAAGVGLDVVQSARERSAHAPEPN